MQEKIPENDQQQGHDKPQPSQQKTKTTHKQSSYVPYQSPQGKKPTIQAKQRPVDRSTDRAAKQTLVQQEEEVEAKKQTLKLGQQKVDFTGVFDRYYDANGNFLWSDNRSTDRILIVTKNSLEQANSTLLKAGYNLESPSIKTLEKASIISRYATPIDETELTSQAISKIYTAILKEMPDVDTKLLHNAQISVNNGKRKANKDTGYKWVPAGYNDPNGMYGSANASRKEGSAPWLKKGKGYTEEGTGVIKVTIVAPSGLVDSMLATVTGAQNALGVHEFMGHGMQGYGFDDKSKYDPNGTHYKAYDLQKSHPTWKKASKEFKEDINTRAKKYEIQRK